MLQHCTLTFPLEDDPDLEVRARIVEEMSAVKAYLRTWQGSCVLLKPPTTSVAEERRCMARELVLPWPRIDADPCPMHEDGRFAKAFPLEFPTGLGDLHQPRLRSDFSVADWVQHVLRYHTGHFLSSVRGHRVIWAVFIAALQAAARDKGLLLHKSTPQTVLTKKDLRDFADARTDLVQSLATFGADIPTTSMHWHRQGSNLEWIVRHMSWAPPWAASSTAGTTAPNVRAKVASTSTSTKCSDSLDADAGETASQPAAPCTLWRCPPPAQVPDEWGYRRIPAFWFTLNLPYNYLFEIHRFHHATTECLNSWAQNRPVQQAAHSASWDPVSSTAHQDRCLWVLDNPDLVVQLHALRAEILVNCVLADVVPASETEPFLYWMRFEFGKNGNPHVHGQCYVAGNPHFETVVKDEAARVSLKAAGRRDVDFLPTWHEAEQQVGTFFHDYILESHPCKDIVGNKRFDFHTDLLTNPFCARPQAFQLLTELKAILTSWRPDLSRLKLLVLALLESGQRHTAHGHAVPVFGTHSCARKNGSTGAVFCRYLFPRDIWTPDAPDQRGKVLSDPHRPDLRNLFLQRNDSLLNNYETHVLLANLGNVDWRALINLWSVLDYLTKYTAKAGEGSKHLAHVFRDVLTKVDDWEKEDGVHDLWRRTILKFYSRVIGDRD